jgi:hypothetical protein
MTTRLIEQLGMSLRSLSFLEKKTNGAIDYLLDVLCGSVHSHPTIIAWLDNVVESEEA